MSNHLFVYMFGNATEIHSRPMLDPYSMRYEYTRYAPLIIREIMRYAPLSLTLRSTIKIFSGLVHIYCGLYFLVIWANDNA